LAFFSTSSTCEDVREETFWVLLLKNIVKSVVVVV
jgi:hypothetical protein